MNKTLKKAIRKAGNQSKLSINLGVTRQYISALVNGHRPVSANTMQILNKYLGV